MDINKLCIHCMNETEGGAGSVCPHCGHVVGRQAELTHQLKPLTILRGKYLVGDVLGEGGFGITYIGLDLNLELRVAIKEFYPNGYATRESASTSVLTIYAGQNAEAVYKWRDNFMKEARSLARCAYLPGVVGVREFFEENNTAYLVMEYIEGETLKDYAKKKGGKVLASELLPAIEPVFKALGEVHKQGLIHRDISPDNIMLLQDGKMKILDFGAAREYAADEKSLSVMLKPGYAPEEQYRTKGKQGPWSDIYALAGTIYKCITGITPPEALERMRQDELQSPNSVGAGLTAGQEAALMRALAVRAEERYQAMEEFRRDLYADRNGALQTMQGSAFVTEQVYAKKPQIELNEPEMSAEEFSRRQEQKTLEKKKKTRAVAAMIFVVAVLICVVVLYSVQGDDNSRQTVHNSVEIQNDTTELESEEPKQEKFESEESEPDGEETSDGEMLEEVSLPEEYRKAYETIMSRFGIDEKTAVSNFTLQNDAFTVNGETIVNYYQDMSYQFYGPGIVDFTFHYPTDLYHAVIFGDNSQMELTENYGTMLQYIDFWGSDGSELLFCAVKRNDMMSLEDMTNYVYFMESQQITDSSKLIVKLNDDNDYGRVIVTGYNSDRSMLIYDLFKVEEEYILQMKVIFPRYTDDYDQMAKDYFTECVYRLCGFSGSTQDVRSFAEYMEQMEADAQ